MKRFAAIAVLAVLFASCGASVDPALQSKIGTYFGKTASRSYSGSAFHVPMPLAVGQYVVYGVTKGDTRSVTRMAVVGSEQDGWIFETYSLTESMESVTQMLVKGIEKARETGKVEDIDIVWVKTKNGKDPVQTIDGPVLSITRGMYRNGMVNYVASVSNPTDGGTVTVPAGTFVGTTKIASEVSFLLSTYKSDGWFHPDVPVNGLVKSVLDNGSTMELLEFGKTGAERSF